MSAALRVSLLGALASLLPAQYDQELKVPTANVTLTAATVADVNTWVGNGYRPIDLEVTSASPLRMNAVFVHNSGVYSQAFAWYAGITAAQVSSFLTTNQARLSELEPYDDGNGNTRFCCVMVNNTGANARQWGWLYNTTTTTIGNVISANGHRIFDLDSYTIGGTTYYSCITILNSGSDQRSWWWYLNVSAAQIGTYVNQNQARLSDLQRRSNGNYDVVMQRDASPPTWHWFIGLTSSSIYPTLDNYAQRPILLDSYVDPLTLQRRYIVVGIQNENDLTAGVCELMHGTTNGTVGAYLKQIGGGEVVGFNQNTVFEPASTLKTLAHAHAMRQVRLGNVTLGTMLPVATSMSGSCPTGSNVVQENLQQVLSLMMENSDNARTAAVVSYFGLAAINNTASALGMASTSWNHTIGCPSGLTTPNELTLADLGRLHDQVAAGYLGTWRDTFYSLMAEGLQIHGLDTVIDQEAASLGGFSAATILSFKNQCWLVHKRGGFDWTTGSESWVERCSGGWIRIPWVIGGALGSREYTFGAFVNHGSSAAAADAAIYDVAVAEMLRPTLRAALVSWSTHLASATSFGAGCGAPNPLQQTTSGLPRLGQTITYVASNAFPGSANLLVYGLSNTNANGIPLPVSVTPFGGEVGCFARVAFDSTAAALADAGGSVSLGLAVPNVPGLLGHVHYTQWFSLGPTAFRTSNGVRTEVGL